MTLFVDLLIEVLNHARIQHLKKFKNTPPLERLEALELALKNMNGA